MKPCQSNTLVELLQMSLNEDVFERILGVLEQEQHKKMEKHREVQSQEVSRF